MKKRDLYENNSSPSYDRLFVPIGHPGRTVAVIRIWREKDTIDWNVSFTDRMYTSDLKAAKEGKLPWLRYVGKVDLEGAIARCLAQGRADLDREEAVQKMQEEIAKQLASDATKRSASERALWQARMLSAKHAAAMWFVYSSSHHATYTVNGARMDESCNSKHRRLCTPAEWAAIWDRVELRCRAKWESLR